MANLDLCAGSVDPIYPPGPGRMVTVIPLEITENGTYTAPNGYAYSPITADVSSATPNDVTFYDYDGTVIAGYTAEQFASMTSLPANPSHEGLVAQGWNWSMEDAKAYVDKYGKLNVGQMYTTDDGKTRLYFNRLVSGNKVTVTLTPTVATGVTIDWGDGSTTVTDSAEKKTYEHTYSAETTPVVTIDVTSGSVAFGGFANDARLWLRKAEIGNGVVSIDTGGFTNSNPLKTITLPNTVTEIGISAFMFCASLQAIIIPSEINVINMSTFNSCYSLELAVLPNSVTTCDDSCLSQCYSLTEMILPEPVTSIKGGAFGNSSCITDFYVYAIVPPELQGNGGMLSSLQNFLIHVPAVSLNAYKTASDWSELADHIVAM